MHYKTQNPAQYVFIIPHWYEKGKTPREFLLSFPSSLQECISQAKHWAYIERCPITRVQFIQCHIPKDAFNKFRKQGTYCNQDELEKFYKLNQEYENKKRVVSILSMFSRSNRHEPLNNDNQKQTENSNS